jgi:hypothetical protein
MDRLSAVLGQAVQFVYTCWDRIVLNGYIERLQRPENLIYFFHDVVGVSCIEPAVLEQRTNAYKAWVRRVTDELGIPVQAAPPAPPKGVRKEDVVHPYYRQLKDAEGIACVLTSLEQGRTFVSYMLHRKPPSGDANYRLIKACRKRFLHYYWYVPVDQAFRDVDTALDHLSHTRSASNPLRERNFHSIGRKLLRGRLITSPRAEDRQDLLAGLRGDRFLGHVPDGSDGHAHLLHVRAASVALIKVSFDQRPLIGRHVTLQIRCDQLNELTANDLVVSRCMRCGHG